jgi:hypothetical protein
VPWNLPKVWLNSRADCGVPLQVLDSIPVSEYSEPHCLPRLAGGQGHPRARARAPAPGH